LANAEPRFRRAVRGDLPDIVRMLADDVLGAKREEYTSPLAASYLSAFDAIDGDPNNELVVGELDGRVVAVLRLVQLTSDKRRGDAIRFYESLGFVASHEGMKLELASR
jgi:hypothetical protein